MKNNVVDVEIVGLTGGLSTTGFVLNLPQCTLLKLLQWSTPVNYVYSDGGEYMLC